MEQANRSFMTQVYVRSPPLLHIIYLLWPSTMLSVSWSIIAFQVSSGVSYLLDYVKDIYDGGHLCPCFKP